MVKVAKTKVFKILAGILALLIIVSVIPMGVSFAAGAAAISNYTVILGENTENIIALDGVEITLTDKADAEKKQTAKTKEGKAVFENFVEENVSYIISVSSIIGYEDVADIEFMVTPEEIAGESVERYVPLTAISTITISGFVKNDNSDPFKDAEVTCTGYGCGENGTSFVTGEDGKYSFNVYIGKEYAISARAKDYADMYTEAGTTVINPTENYICADLILSIKQFNIKTTVGEGGSVNGGGIYNYGEYPEITVKADDGYRIDTLSIDGNTIDAAKGQQNYEYTFENITEKHSVEVTFVRKTYKINFTVGENGYVTYNEGTEKIEGGHVEFEESTDPNNPTEVNIKAVPNDVNEYRVSRVKINDDEKEFNDNGYVFEKSLTMTQEYNVEVEFALNNYTLIVNSDENGNVTVDKNSVEYGESATVTIAPNDGYNIDTIKINGTESGDYTLDESGTTYSLIISNITENIEVEVKYSEIEDIKMEDSGITVTPDEVKIDDSDDEIVKYIYTHNSTVAYKVAENNRIAVNDVRSTKNVWGTTESFIINKIEVFDNSDLKWRNIELPQEIQIIIDNTAPAVVKPDKNDMGWSHENTVTLSGEATDDNSEEKPSSGLSWVVWSKGEKLSEKQVLEEVENSASKNKVKINADGTYSFVSDEGEQDIIYYIYAVDVAGNVSEAKEVNVRLDRTQPSVTNFIYSTEEKTVIDDIISFLSFGTICKQTVYVTVLAEDKNGKANSGVDKISLYCGDKELTPISEVKGESATFELTKTQFMDGKEISAVATDNACNSSVVTKPTDNANGQAKSDIVQINDAKPTADIKPPAEDYKDTAGKLWYNNDVQIIVTAFDNDKTDNNAEIGIKSISIWLNDVELEKDNSGKKIKDVDFSSSKTLEEEFIINTSQNHKDGENKIEVVVTNNAGVECKKVTQYVYIDTTPPDVIGFQITKKGGEVLEKILNFLTFGCFFNEQVEVTVTAGDENASSGIREITLYADEKYAGEKVFGTQSVNNENKATFTIPAKEVTDGAIHFNKKLSAKATDKVGNTTEKAVEPTTVNSDIKNSGLMIETIKPKVSVSLESPVTNRNQATADSNDWYAENVSFTITANDEKSGLRKVEILINGTPIGTDINNKNISEEFNKREKITLNETFTVSTEQAKIKDDGSYTLTVTVTDNAGNVSDNYTKTIYKDIDAPYITGFDFEPVNFVEGSETNSSVEVTDYGFYFKADTKVTVGAKDESPSSGVKYITYFAVDKDTGKKAEKTVLVNKDGEIEFTVNANFKGQIYALPTDNVGNKPASFVTPNSTIVEDEDKHKEETHIFFNKEKTDLKTNDNSELYAKDVPVTLTVSDTYSGIRSVEWSVIAPYDTDNNQQGSVTLNNDKTLTENSDKDWKQTKTELNLVTEMKKTITVSNNSNNIAVSVKMTDRAGNTSEDKIEFSIDKTSPVIKVEYDNNTPDATYKDIYKDNRTATITVTERNFNSKDIECKITNTDGVIPTVSGWEENKNTEKPDETTYTATVAYTADGDYTFDISYSDLAKNPSNKIDQQKFTIDKTVPTVSVSYDNNSVINGNYYKADRTATITIVEHNFDSSRVKVNGTATDNGSTRSFPATGRWNDNGDIHTATISYSYDAKYSFDIEFKDKAGNSIADYPTEQFFIDKTDPTLEISGVSDKSANNGTVAPVITYSDTNFNRNDVSIVLSGVNNGDNLDYSGAYEEIGNGQIFTYADFDKSKKVDDIYTLAVALKDMAGNETEKKISFSANRFGSVYDLTQVKSMNGKYLQAEKDIVFTETNVDALNQEKTKLKLTKNGTPTDLKEGVDYTVEATGGNGKWSQYKYTVKKSLFENDGRYAVSAYSVDAAGNINETIDEKKNAEISFGIDKTDPVIVPVDIESGQQYAIENKTASVEIKDNLVLEDVKIYLNDEAVKFDTDGEIYTFDIPEANNKQNVKIVAVDAAGNDNEVAVEQFLVSTNFFVRWYNNTLLFFGSIVGVVVIALAITAFIVFGRKKKDKEETDGMF